MDAPEIRYARSGDASIAYAVLGDGPVDLVFIPGGFQHLELWWEDPPRARLGQALLEHARLIQLDKRGTGLSDRGGPVASLETRMDDIRAVMDAAGSERAVVFAVHDTAPLALLFAATFPERVAGLVLWHPQSAFVRTPDQPWLPTRGEYEAWFGEQERRWGEHDYWDGFLKQIAPSLASRAERLSFARVLRLSVSPGDARAFAQLNGEIDVRHVLPTIRVPTLVLATAAWEPELRSARYHAERIPTARLAVLPGPDWIPSVGDPVPLIAELAPFLEEVREGSACGGRAGSRHRPLHGHRRVDAARGRGRRQRMARAAPQPSWCRPPGVGALSWPEDGHCRRRVLRDLRRPRTGDPLRMRGARGCQRTRTPDPGRAARR